MTELLYILRNISLPIIAIVLAGFGFQKIFKTNVRTYSKLMMYLLVPVMLFTYLYRADITWDFLSSVVPFVLILTVVMFFVGLLVSRILKYKKSKRNATSNVMILSNTGNYGIPLIALVFNNNPIATASQLIIGALQNVATSTAGVYLSSSGKLTKKQSLMNIIKMPALYSLLLVAIIKMTHFEVPALVLIPLDYISNAFIGMALLSLGIQLAEVKVSFHLKDILTVSLAKIVITPILGFGLALLLGIEGLLAQALIIGTSMPTAVNAVILENEFNNEPDFTAQIVVATTVFCTFTLPAIIYFVRIYF